MGVHLREKKMGNGQISLYLDIYHNKTRWYEFLNIHINKGRLTPEDKEKKRLAQEIRSKRESELIVQDNGLINKNRKKADFMPWFEKYLSGKTFNTQHSSTLYNLRNYLGKKPLSFAAITPVWIGDFKQYLLKRVSNNSTRSYLMVIFTALEEAVRQEIIQKNPFRLIEKKDRIKKQEIFRHSFTLEQLQSLAQTPCKIEPQIKQAFLFSCFSGLRWSDINQLRWSEIITKTIDGQEEHFIYFEQEKTEGIEYLPLTDQAVKILKERKQLHENSPYVFPKIKEKDTKNNITLRRVNSALKKWATAAGLNPGHMHFHVARHTFATNILECSPEADLWTVSKLLGHKSIQSTQIYAHVRDRKKTAAVKALPSLE